MKTSRTPLASPATRFVASDAKATCVPSWLIAALKLSPFASLPSVATLTRWITPIGAIATLWVVGLSYVVGVLIAIPIGVISAYKQFDRRAPGWTKVELRPES